MYNVGSELRQAIVPCVLKVLWEKIFYDFHMNHCTEQENLKPLHVDLIVISSRLTETLGHLSKMHLHSPVVDAWALEVDN